MHGMAWYRHSRDFWGFMGPQTGVLGATRRNLTSERAVQVHSLIRKTEKEGTGRTYPRHHDEVRPPVAEVRQVGDERRLPSAGDRTSPAGIAESGLQRQDGDGDTTDPRSPLIWTSPIISNLVCT
ncbi:hypothetical protein CGRA01v4_04972 [Colletotrichum graminicola]|uniref:Uncharacterized protein n=1 Tax=Colletotrichum graminicola (strain M1.001 / M2 / FGSC 10212) TaxID=645133 RepID=E3QEG7_COLGM|nr:uncharacterized protein GLRG_04417 [Colletotrichum graminicola M1.001]EFQ29273.1 hypothetical protein GLRG_04417 [Colletotrichum graminicola M1.001]WDK13691.1 hypothetical protein CGRA01v4_04972 [Colletotrichum graminicola]